MSEKGGIKKHGDKEKEVFFVELLQLHYVGVFYPTHKYYLIKSKIKKIIRVLSVTK